MNKIAAKLLYGVVIIEILTGFVLGILVYYVRYFDKATGTYTDGLWRPLEVAPFFIRLFLSSDSLWPGWGYATLDIVVFVSGVSLGSFLVGRAAKLRG